MDWMIRGWAETSNNKNQLGSKASQELTRAGSRTHWHAQNLALGEVLMEEPGQLHWQDTAPVGEYKNHNREQPRTGQREIPTIIHMA